MALVTEYHPGGFIADAPAKNKSREYDSQARTYTTWDRSGNQLTSRALTSEEQAALARQDEDGQAIQNGASLPEKVRQALATNAAYLGLANPTAAQNTAQIKSLTRQLNALIRLELRDFTDVTGT